MSALTEPELKQLFDSLAQFSDNAVQGAIEDARDPYKAGQFVQRLRKAVFGKTQAGLVELALCVVLGEAKAAVAAPILIDAVLADPGGLLAEAATYALQRMGGQATEAVLANLDGATQPSQRIGLYRILRAAVADTATGAKIREAVKNRLETSPVAQERKALDELLQWLDGQHADEQPEWQVEWSVRCRQWVEQSRRKPIGPKPTSVPAPTRATEPPPAFEGQEKAQDPVRVPFRREEKKTRRNDPCPCGSGKKFKKCCGH